MYGYLANYVSCPHQQVKRNKGWAMSLTKMYICQNKENYFK